jgi:hypothetical protein
LGKPIYLRRKIESSTGRREKAAGSLIKEKKIITG